MAEENPPKGEDQRPKVITHGTADKRAEFARLQDAAKKGKRKK